MDLKLGKYKLSIINNSNNLTVSGNSKALITNNNIFGNLNLLSNYKFADVILYQLIEKLNDAMSGIVWSFDGSNYRIVQLRLKKIFEKEFSVIYKSLYFKGICVFAINFETQDAKILIDAYKLNQNGTITVDKEYEEYNIYSIYSDTYKIFGTTDYNTCKDMFRHIDNIMNAMNATTENLGAMGIISPESTAGVMSKLSDKEEEKIQSGWREKYGLKVGKWSIMISSVPTRFQQINLPIKDLELESKLQNAVKILAGYHKIPYELLAISGQSTYANRKEAMNELIELTCKSYANKLYDLLTEIFFAKLIKFNYEFEHLNKK
jgi:hypothetical protein